MANFRYRLFGGHAPIKVDDYTEAARRKVPAMAWPYLSGGADDLVTMADNRDAFRRWRLKVRSLTGVARPDLSTTIAGTKVSLPIGLAPTGMVGLAHWTGDIAAAKAAEAAGTRHVLSTASSYTMEEVAEATEQNHWFQLYPFADKPKVAELMTRAEQAGYTALFVTVDVGVIGNREGERRSGMTIPPTFTARRLLEAGTHPAWWWNLLKHRRAAPIHYITGPRTIASAVEGARDQARRMQGDLNWDDVAWMRDHWKGPFYIKGILDPDDAERAVSGIGAQGVVVSNHGGRQLDSCLGALDALPPIVERIGGRGEVYLDGGVRRGTDVLIALALGAKGVFVGRPYVHGLAADGQAGVTGVLDIFRAELVRDMVLMGLPSIEALDRSWVLPAG
ncbi:alpha-hydroxy acid oxidase [uncultured Phenylobacterium sp.]|uniref:alpha-hydroxy acid oxidase n=1 Tax=uncultured Phenylobacterium sp. TaxID=349273 RepID=UPI0025D73044|nr:alpha-hydroxy acid oxidase [uncultured Phenylobacterium sp.]